MKRSREGGGDRSPFPTQWKTDYKLFSPKAIHVNLQ